MSDDPCGDPEVHAEHGRPGLMWCPGTSEADVRDSTLLVELAEAGVANMHARPCQVCVALEGMSEVARVSVESALAGTIGERSLAEILTRNGYPTGRRAVQNHRREAHQ